MSLRKIFHWILNAVVLVPLMWLSAYVTRYTLERQQKRAERRYIDILASTEDFATWREAAKKLDELRNFNQWRFEKPLSAYVNAEAIVEETRVAVQLYQSRNMPVIGEYLRTHLSRSANGLTHPLLFRYYTGTKACVEEYITAVGNLIRLYAAGGEDGGDDAEPVVAEPHAVVEKPNTPFAHTDGKSTPAGAHQKPRSLLAHYTRSLLALARQDTEANVSVEDRFTTLYETAQSYGRSALMLSGGASLGMYHTGLVRALYGAKLLPQIITGSSAGAIISGIICTRNEEELEALLDSDLGLIGVSLNAFDHHEDVRESVNTKLQRIMESGAYMDVETLCECLRQNCGNLTFKEAFEHSGRIMNISVASLRHGEHQDRAVLLNYVTAPNVVVWNAIAASCAMPGLFTAVELIEKRPDGSLVPFLKGQKFFDGSVARDLPKEGIASLFNVNYFIVSQTNPHVIPFSRSPPSPLVHKRRPGLISALWFGACAEANYWIQKLFRFGLLPKTGGFAVPYLMATQSYEGDITIYPIGNVLRALPDFINLTTNPSAEHMKYVTALAQRRTWPFLTQIYCVSEIERTLQEEIRFLQQRLTNTEQRAK